MNYISLETNALITLVGRKNGKIDWANMGTDADTINLDNNKVSVYNPTTENDIYYILPISNMDNATLFKQATEAKYGITVNIITEEQAIQNKQLFLDSLPVK
jgi:hypothetical protein